MVHNLTIDKEFMKLIPPLLEEEYRQLEKNILAKGKLINPIILWDGIIVDGHNRFYICMQHGIEFEVTDIAFETREDAKLWILENQLGRRNLTDAARIELALKKEKLLKALAKERQTLGGKHKGKLLPKSSTGTLHVQRDTAKNANVSKGSLVRYKQIMQEGSPALIEDVKSGKLKIGTAHRLLPSRVEKRLMEAEKMCKYIFEHLNLVTDENEKADVNEKLLFLREQLAELMEKRKANEVKN